MSTNTNANDGQDTDAELRGKTLRELNDDIWGPNEVPEGVETPYGEEVSFWVADGSAYAFGHEVTVTGPEDEMNRNVWVESGQALCFASEDHDFTIHPYKAHPETWEVFLTSGVKGNYEGEIEPGVFEWTTDKFGGELQFHVHIPSLVEDGDGDE